MLLCVSVLYAKPLDSHSFLSQTIWYLIDSPPKSSSCLLTSHSVHPSQWMPIVDIYFAFLNNLVTYKRVWYSERDTSEKMPPVTKRDGCKGAGRSLQCGHSAESRHLPARLIFWLLHVSELLSSSSTVGDQVLRSFYVKNVRTWWWICENF